MIAPNLSARIDLPAGNANVRFEGVRVLSQEWYVLRQFELMFRRRDGSWNRQLREAYDRGDGAAILLYNLDRNTVILTRQFRLPAYLNGLEDGMLIETAAGLLDEMAPADCIRKETQEETGYVIGMPEQIHDLFMSPGSVTERLHLFVAPYEPSDRTTAGGGNPAEGEDIEVLEIPFSEALAMCGDGRIRDAKTVILIYHMRVRGMM
ncbi:MAG: NUDIX domain-containing protein [Nitratireductor sp.]